MATKDLLPQLTNKQLDTILHDPQKTARAVNLLYVTDSDEGITRLKKGKNFSYQFQDQIIKSKEDLGRIKSLVIPPAWQSVWICKDENGHLQCTGVDAKQRKQYKYHTMWNSFRNHTKFYRLYQFGQVLPSLRLQLEKDLAKRDLSKEKVLALVVSLMERTHIRVGNSMYEKLYGSYGLTTLKDKHVDFTGSKVNFCFVGKKGVKHDITLKNKRLAKIVKSCQDIPGKELFQYYDDNGNRHSIDSGMVNEYIKTLSGGDYTAKDFRTWAGTVEALMAFSELGLSDTKKDTKQNIVMVLDRVSEQLGNTRAVCKKYYVHPAMLSLYEDHTLDKYLTQLDTIEQNDKKTGLTREEKLLMQILEKC